MPTASRVSRSVCILAIIALAALAQRPQAAPAVDLNSASVEQLMELPGIGEAYAKKIVDGRPYKSADDLKAAGIPAATIEKLRPLVTAKTAKAQTPEKPARDPAGKAAGGKLDLNSATAAELEELPGVGEATSKKIIAGRPYKSVDDLKEAGVSAAAIEKLRPLVAVRAAQAEKPAKLPGGPAPKEPGGKLDLNSATAAELEELPGVGEATSKKIIAGRPYKSVDDLKEAGVSPATITRISPLVTIASGRRAETPTVASGKPAAPAGEKPAQPTGDKPGAKVDLNTATAAQLEELPGVGEVTAQKIIKGRPYKSVDDLKNAGVAAATITKITPLVTATAATAVKDAEKAAQARPASGTQKPAPTAGADEPNVPTRTAPAKGMVWLNTDSKIFHKEGSRWYGKTKEGQFMTEQEAIKAGGRESKED